jgi:putative flippase GtrA
MLRAGLEYFRREMEGFMGIITVAAQEGYTVDDVLHMVAAMAVNPGKLITASRAANPVLGWRQRFVKACAGRFFSALHGRAIQDPWAGLRAIPAAIVPSLQDLKGDGRRFAFNIVLNLQHKGIKNVNVPVSARYEPGEGLERSERIKDIFRILALPFTFISASLTATAADYAVFLTLDTLLMKGHWAVSITISRSTGAIVGYFLNRNLVFRRKNDGGHKELVAAAQFALLALINYGMSLLFVYLLHDLLFINEIIARFCSDVVLFITSYVIQREIIFKRKMPIPN